jgi:hypothetical protein
VSVLLFLYSNIFAVVQWKNGIFWRQNAIMIYFVDCSSDDKNYLKNGKNICSSEKTFINVLTPSMPNFENSIPLRNLLFLVRSSERQP